MAVTVPGMQERNHGGQAGECVVSNQDIREWARANGHPDISDRGRIAGTIVEEYEAANAEPDDDEAPFQIVPSDAPPEPQEPPADAPTPEAKVTEKPPVAPRRDRLGALRRRTQTPTPPGKAPAKRLPRVSAADVLGFAYSGLGYVAARSPRGVPTARSMDLMAPVAGEILDDVLKGTFIDRIMLQPVARNSEKAQKIAALTAFPALVSLVSARPELYPACRPMMRMAIVLSLEVSEAPMKKLQKKAEEFEEKFGAINIDGMIDAVFADLDMPVQHSADEDAAVRRAQNGD